MTECTQTGVNLTRQLGCHWYALISQAEYWLPDRRPQIRVADMDGRWRYNTARWLLRRAATIELYCSIGEMVHLSTPVPEVIGEDERGPVEVHRGATLMPAGEMTQLAFEREWDVRAADPAAWLRRTPLFLALVAGLDDAPTADSEPRISPGFGEPRNHLSECPWAGGRRDIDCACRDTSPEWTLS